MLSFVFVNCLLVVNTLAHPEAGYTYNGSSQKSSPAQHLIQQQEVPAENVFSNFASPPSTSYGTPLSTDALLNSIENSLANSGDINYQNQVQPLPLDQQDSYNAAYQDSSNAHEGGSGGYAYAQLPTTIYKHVYVHAPPKDFELDDVIETRVRHAPAAKQKHYKIIFIKAPASPAIRSPVVPQQQQNEEKTLIYVLHKKPENVKDIVIPAPAPAKPSKPEVYFIKYKTKKEESPVYGPPPLQLQSGNLNFADMDPRHGDAPASTYNAPVADEYTTDLTAPLTTVQPDLEHEQQQQQQQQKQFLNDLPSDAFVLHEQSQSIAEMPSNQYLAPETMAPIVVEEPSSNYGPPAFFQKQK